MTFYTLVSDSMPLLSIYSTNREEIEATAEQYMNTTCNCTIQQLERVDMDYTSALTGIAHWEFSANDPSSYALVLDRKYRNTGIRNILASITKEDAGYSYVTTTLGQFNLFATEGPGKHKSAQAGYLHDTSLAVACAQVERLITDNLKTLRAQADALILRIEG